MANTSIHQNQNQQNQQQHQQHQQYQQQHQHQHQQSLVNKIPDMLLHGAGSGAIKSVIVYDVTTRILPAVIGGVIKWVSERLEKRAQRIYKKVLERSLVGGTHGREKSAIMVLDRNFKLSGSTNDMFDAVLAVASDVVDARCIRRTAKGVFVIDSNDEIRIAAAADVYFKKMSIVEADGELEHMSIQVYSWSKNIVELRTFLNNLEEVYLKNKGNQLGRNLYYFDELPITPPVKFSNAGGGGVGGNANGKSEPDLSKAFPNITFNMFALHTNKSLKNLYGACARNAKKRVEFFMNNEQWYIDRGIPYTLGILMHGAPGCGKTSFIKALARDTRRHVVNIKMGPTTTVQQINNLFYTPRLSVVRDGATQTFDIPMEKRIIVMEDVDCLSCVVRDTPGANVDPHQLNLSILLNILDGVLETPGRIIIMTSNEPWKLDAALKRPGRIDVNIEFTKCSAMDMVEMIEGITGWKVPLNAIDGLANGMWTPAEVTKTIFENMDNPAQCLEVFAAPTPVHAIKEPVANVYVPSIWQPSALEINPPMQDQTICVPLIWADQKQEELTIPADPILQNFEEKCLQNLKNVNQKHVDETQSSAVLNVNSRETCQENYKCANVQMRKCANVQT